MIRRIFGLRGSGREDRRDRLADEAHHILREYRLLDGAIIEFMEHRPNRPGREIGRPDEVDAIGRANPHQPPGRNRTAHETHMVSRRKVRRKPAAPAHQRRILEAPDRAAHPRHSRAGGRIGHDGNCSVDGVRSRPGIGGAFERDRSMWTWIIP